VRGELDGVTPEQRAVVTGPRLDLEPLRVEHAREMAPLLEDPALHTFIGGEPATLTQLQQRYQRQLIGRSPDGSQLWMNWVLRRRVDGRAVGTVQATVSKDQTSRVGLIAEVAWVVATRYQGQGYAREAAQVMVTWLREQGVTTVRANIHPGHTASQMVARAVGLTETATVVDGETRWEGSWSGTTEMP